MTGRHIYNDSRVPAVWFKAKLWLIKILVYLTINELPWKTKYLHWAVVACQPCAFGINHVDNGFRSQAERNHATCIKMQRRPASFSSVCWAVQSSWRTSQNTINVNHQNDCRSGTFRLSEVIPALLLVERLKVYPGSLFLLSPFSKLLSALFFGSQADHFFNILLVLEKIWHQQHAIWNNIIK